MQTLLCLIIFISLGLILMEINKQEQKNKSLRVQRFKIITNHSTERAKQLNRLLKNHCKN